jgi:tetratricopeptide (TPR) repeat protein
VAIGRTLLGADQEQALGALEEAVRQEPRSLRIRLFLGQTFVQHGRLDAALALCRETAAQNPRYVTARRDFGKALLMMGRLDEARAELLEAVRVDASDPDTRNCLGRLFRDRGDIDAAIVHLREALRLLPRSHWVRANLASMLTKKGELDEALELLRQSIKILPSADACIQLSYVLWKQDDFNEALAAAREAVRLSSGRPSAEALIALGRARKCTGDLDGAVSNYRRALLLRPEHAELLCNLGQALNERGDFREGLEILRAGHERGSGNPRWSYPSDQWVRDAERLVALEARLDEVRRGAGAPPGPKERVQLAMEVCHRKRLFAETASLLEAAFCEDPSLTSNRPTSNRSYGAASALAAGLAQGADAPADAGARSALRNRARAWFEEEITFLERRMESGIGRGSTARKALSRLSTEPALLRTLDPPTLSSLPPGEAEAWRAFKIRLDELLKRLPEE